ncbi:MAG: adenylate/guanylate cyclase domain-containing protein [bacterium]
MDINSPKFRYKIKRVLLLTAGWVITAIYITIIQLTSILIVLNSKDMPVKFSYRQSLIEISIEVFFAGLVFALIEVFYFTDRFKNKSFTYAVLIQSFFYAMSLTLFTLIIFYIELVTNGSNFFSDFSKIALPLLLTLFIWGPIFVVSIFILQVSDRFGHGVLLKFILGKYHKPKEETRIFMILDIKSSTSIAEALGNVKYFELLNDFFYDITDSIIEARGEIYQYVGDEIVVTWKLENGVMNANALNCFFDIYNVIKDLSEKYETKYGLVPSFKASIHYGTVTVGEVGVMKREITFSGDVLNTTARIQELCNKYKEKLIVSKHLLDLISSKDEFILKEIGQMNLRGRSEPVVLYSVRKN